MIMKKILVALAASAAVFAAPASATILLSDNFDAEAGGVSSLNHTAFANWTVEGGTVDVVANTDYGITCFGNSGSCVDLDGSTNDPGLMVSTGIFSFAAFQQLSFFVQASGNQRIGSSDDLALGFRYIPANNEQTVFTQTFAGFDPFGNYGVTGSFNGAVNVRLLIGSAPSDGAGSDNIGVIIDNVVLSTPTVPEPASWAMMIAGFGLVGGAMRRRTRVSFATA